MQQSVILFKRGKNVLYQHFYTLECMTFTIQMHTAEVDRACPNNTHCFYKQIQKFIYPLLKNYHQCCSIILKKIMPDSLQCQQHGNDKSRQ